MAGPVPADSADATSIIEDRVEDPGFLTTKKEVHPASTRIHGSFGRSCETSRMSRGEELDDAVDKLLEEMRQDKKAQSRKE